MHLIANVIIRISHAKFHCNRLYKIFMIIHDLHESHFFGTQCSTKLSIVHCEA